MNYIFIKVPKTASTFFERNFHGKVGNINGQEIKIESVGHRWLYQTHIRGWLDWDNPNQQQGMYNPISPFRLRPDDKVVTVVRNPFDLLFSYFNYNWAWCRKFHNLPTDSYTKKDFQDFVDIYLNENIPFHAPAFKKSLFSQLKTEDGKWILKNDSIVLRFENINDEIETFSKLVNIPITNRSRKSPDSNSKNEVKLFSWKEAYRDDQVSKLKELWKEDLEYLGYDFPKKEPKKPKVAVCFSGLIRDIQYTKEFWNNLIKEYDADVYASMWDVENEDNGDTIHEFKKMYNFKELEIEKYSSFEKSTLYIYQSYFNAPKSILNYLQEYAKDFITLPMWYKIWKSNMLSKNYDVEYDVVIRARTDSYIKGDLILENNGMLNVPNGRVQTNGWKNSDGINDSFAFGNAKIMDYYSSTYLSLVEYAHQNHYRIPPEYLLHVHLNKVKMMIRFFKEKIVLTRYSKGKEEEVYNRQMGPVEEILPSDFMNLEPSKEHIWFDDKKSKLKF